MTLSAPRSPKLACPIFCPMFGSAIWSHEGPSPQTAARLLGTSRLRRHRSDHRPVPICESIGPWRQARRQQGAGPTRGRNRLHRHTCGSNHRWPSPRTTNTSKNEDAQPASPRTTAASPERPLPTASAEGNPGSRTQGLRRLLRPAPNQRTVTGVHQARPLRARRLPTADEVGVGEPKPRPSRNTSSGPTTLSDHTNSRRRDHSPPRDTREPQPREHAAFRLLAATGARSGEICGLRWSSVDLDRRVLWIRHSVARLKTGKLIQKDPKSHQTREVAIDKNTAKILRDHRKRQNCA